MRARYLLVTDVTENEGRRKTELLNHETRTLVSSECQEDRLGHMEGTTADGAHGGTFGGAPPKCVYLCVTAFSVQFSCSLVSGSLQPHGLQHTRPPCPSPTPGACSNSCPLSQWCHPTISSSVIPLSSCLQSFPVLGSFPMCKFFA